MKTILVVGATGRQGGAVVQHLIRNNYTVKALTRTPDSISALRLLSNGVSVIKGDMSLVGNRPLPLFEAEMLTSNEWSQRFMGPAGVTGLWQIKSRGKKDISARERKKFDNFYASKYSFWFDLEIMIKTVPLIFHKEKF